MGDRVRGVSRLGLDAGGGRLVLGELRVLVRGLERDRSGGEVQGHIARAVAGGGPAGDEVACCDHAEYRGARESILNVEGIGRDALAEMRRLLGLLRKDDDPRALTPQPGLDQLPELARTLEDAGLVFEPAD
jgi:hypothetical protein